MTSKLYYLAMNTSKKHPESISEMKRQRTANKNAAIVMTLLFIALLTGNLAISAPDGSLDIGDIAWGSLSVAAFGGLLWSLYISYKQSDERQQLVQLKATSLTFMIVIFGVVIAQILHALAIVSLNITVQVIIIGGILTWISLMKVVERRSS